MDWNEATRTLAVLGPVFGIVSAVLGVLVWLLKSHIQSKNEQIAQLKLDKQTLEADVAEARADIKRFQYEREDAVRRKEEAERSVAPFVKEVSDLTQQVKALEKLAVDHKAEADKHKASAEKYLAAGQNEYKKRKEAEARADKAEDEAKQAQAKAAKAETEAKSAGESAKKRAETTELSLSTAIKLRNEAEAKAQAANKDRNALAATVERLTKQIEAVTNQDGRVWAVPVGPEAPPFIPLAERRTPVISILNLKGGVGKTTITANLAGYLGATVGKRVLMIDLDHQRSLTQLLLSTDTRKAAAIARRTVQDFLLSEHRSGIDLHSAAEKVPGLEICSVITNSDADVGFGTRKNLDDVEMSLLGRWLVNPTANDVRFLMRPALQSCTVGQEFDYVLIDCPPRLTTACINALTASDFVLIPAQAEEISIRSVPHLLGRLKALRDAGVLPQLRVLGIIANMVSAKVQERGSPEAKLLRNIEETAQRVWGNPVKAFKATLRDSGYYASATRELNECQKLSLAVENKVIREQYEPLFKEIEGRINESIGVARVSS
jgi:cellulose biosynthesis protein BcsQ